MPPLSRWTDLPWEASGDDGSGHSPHYTAPPPYRSAVRTGHAHQEVRDRLVHDVPNLTAAPPDLTERRKQGLCPPLQPSRKFHSSGLAAARDQTKNKRPSSRGITHRGQDYPL